MKSQALCLSLYVSNMLFQFSKLLEIAVSILVTLTNAVTYLAVPLPPTAFVFLVYSPRARYYRWPIASAIRYLKSRGASVSLKRSLLLRTRSKGPLFDPRNFFPWLARFDQSFQTRLIN